MRLARLVLLGNIGLLSCAATAEELGDAGAGAVYAQRVCSECHAVQKGEGYSPNPDAPTFESIAETHGMSERAVDVWLQTSHPNMPNIIVEPQDRDNVAAYIMSLKTKK